MHFVTNLPNSSYWPYVSNLAGYFSKAKCNFENLLGLKHNANNNYFAFILKVLAVCNS